MTVNTEQTDIAIIGAGVIGLALAREFARRYSDRSITLFEQAAHIGTGISSRSSEVIHAGIYYPASWLKSSLCVRGREMLYAYCEQRHIPHRRLGKLVVANTDEEHEFLHALALRAEFSGVTDLRWLTRQQVSELEPAVRAKGAFLSPSTGIVDSAALMSALEKDCRDSGVTVAPATRVEHIHRTGTGFELVCTHTRPPAESFRMTARVVINSAGLQAVELARRIDGFPAQHIPEIRFAKGDYFSYAGPNPFTRLVYPVPSGQPLRSPNAQHTSLGIHATIDLQGRLRFGPDLHMVEQEDYRVNETSRSTFAETVRRYFPALEADKLQPAYAGIRPRLTSSNNKTPDFLLQTAHQHGIPGLVNLFGIESPGLTSCLALADHVANQVAALQLFPD